MKYELVNYNEETKLYRIKALKDFANVKAGDLGGWIERESNLSQDGNCWVYENARVYEDAKVYGDAMVSGNAKVYGDAMVSGNAWVYGDAEVSGNAKVSGNAGVYGDAEVYGNAKVSGNAWVSGDARVCNGNISKTSDYIVLKNVTTSGRWFTYNFSSKTWCIGCFQGTTEELLKHLDENGTEKQKAEYICSIEYVNKLNELRG